MRALVTATTQWGHVAPILPVVKQLIAANTKVWWAPLALHRRAFSLGAATPGLRAVGVQIHDLGTPDFADEDAGRAGPEDYKTPEDFIAENVRVFRQTEVERMPLFVERIQKAIRELQIDLVIADGWDSGGTIAAKLEGVRSVTITPNVVHLFPAGIHDANGLRDVSARMEPEIRQMVRSFGVDLCVQKLCVYSDDLNVLPFPLELTERLGLESSTAPALLQVPYYPPWEEGRDPRFPWDALDGDAPLLFAAFGSDGFFRAPVAANLVRTAERLKMQLVLAVNNRAAGELRGVLRPSDVLVDWAPQRALLARASVFVTHGGANSISEALWAGTPMLVSPVWRDQPAMAELIDRAELGLELDLRNAAVVDCVERVRQLKDPASRQNAAVRRFGEMYRKRNGAAEVAARIGQLFA
jgi:zeaxanthin glucosyltransferase